MRTVMAAAGATATAVTSFGSAVAVASQSDKHWAISTHGSPAAGEPATEEGGGARDGDGELGKSVSSPPISTPAAVLARWLHSATAPYACGRVICSCCCGGDMPSSSAWRSSLLSLPVHVTPSQSTGASSHVLLSVCRSDTLCRVSLRAIDVPLLVLPRGWPASGSPRRAPRARPSKSTPCRTAPPSSAQRAAAAAMASADRNEEATELPCGDAWGTASEAGEMVSVAADDAGELGTRVRRRGRRVGELRRAREE